MIVPLFPCRKPHRLWKRSCSLHYFYFHQQSPGFVIGAKELNSKISQDALVSLTVVLTALLVSYFEDSWTLYISCADQESRTFSAVMLARIALLSNL